MKVLVNNKEVETSAATLSQLIGELDLPTQGIAVAVDNRIAPRTTWETYPLQEGVAIVINKAACGG